MRVGKMDLDNVAVMPNIIFNQEPATIKIVPTEERSLTTLKKEKNQFKKIQSFIKRVIDIIAGIVGTVILVPLIVFVYVFNKINKVDDGPLFFVQERIGKNGKLFKMIKFRTMCMDADEKLEKFLSENEDVKKEFLLYRKIKNDPRITKAGKLLRKTSLDEWPQFISLITGEMSLVRTTTISAS